MIFPTGKGFRHSLSRKIQGVHDILSVTKGVQTVKTRSLDAQECDPWKGNRLGRHLQNRSKLHYNQDSCTMHTIFTI